MLLCLCIAVLTLTRSYWPNPAFTVTEDKIKALLKYFNKVYSVV
jgi:hypothetical protein